MSTIEVRGEPDEIWVKSPTIPPGGYDNRPEINAAVFRDGYYNTGDVGRLDERGHLIMTGRKQIVFRRRRSQGRSGGGGGGPARPSESSRSGRASASKFRISAASSKPSSRRARFAAKRTSSIIAGDIWRRSRFRASWNFASIAAQRRSARCCARSCRLRRAG